MAERRRDNLRSGLFELYTRHKVDQKREADKAAVLEADLTAAREAPERDDDRLTRPSVRSEILALLEKRPTVPRHEQPHKIAARKSNYSTRNQKLVLRRREALRKLFIDARHFVVSPSQLDDAIETAFGSESDPVTWGTHASLGVWGLGARDPMLDIAQMSQRSTLTTPTTSRLARDAVTSGERLVDIAEALVPDVEIARLKREEADRKTLMAARTKAATPSAEPTEPTPAE